MCAVLAVLVAAAAGAPASNGYADRVGDVKGGAGPDIARVTVSSTATKVMFRVRFATSPPLGVSTRNGWVDMLLIGIDVPPLGARPRVPGGEWPGADFALGTHGPSPTGTMVRLGSANEVPVKPTRVATFKILTRASTLTFSIPRRTLGRVRWFTFTVAAARERENGGGVDLAPARGTFRYVLTG